MDIKKYGGKQVAMAARRLIRSQRVMKAGKVHSLEQMRARLGLQV